MSEPAAKAERPTKAQLVKDIARANPFRLVDAGGNHSCIGCGSFRDFRSHDGTLGAGQHRPTCWWAWATVLADIEE
ncbi:MAG: hypothetical protein PVS2B1_17120 [Candidatus Dormibacteraceae bacterium]